MAGEKSIVKEALLDIEDIKGVLSENTKEVLRLVAKEEAENLLKESLKEEDYVEEEVEDMEKQDTDETEPEEETEVEVEDEMTDDTEMGDVDLEIEDEDEDETETDDTELDLTGASDEEVLTAYKELSGDDEIEVIGDEIHLTITEPGKYVIKTGEDVTGVEDETEMGDEDTFELEMDDEDDETEMEMGDEDEDEMVYEIEMGDMDEMEELDEKIAGNLPQAKFQHELGYKTAPKSPAYRAYKKLEESFNVSQNQLTETTSKYKKVLVEAAKLKQQNDEFKDALKKLRTMVSEMVVYNTNLTNVTKLFTEHSTTKDEKSNILKRFDNEVKTIEESKKLYKSLVTELSAKKPISESVDKVISTGNSKQLNESTVYADPSTKRIQDLISRLENR